MHSLANARRLLRIPAIGIAALALATVGSTGASAASGPGPLVGLGIHRMATLTETRYLQTHPADCVLPLVVSVECVGYGTPMTYGGGPIQSAPSVYIVFWGWTSDPAGMAAYQEAFFNGAGGSQWNSSQTQYCNQTSDLLGTTCSPGATHVGNPTGLLKGTWSDNTNAVPQNPDDAAIQAEAARAAAHFNNTTAASNASTQYIIDTPHGNSTTGFGTQWCAYHGMVSSNYGGLSYTDFPYISDAGGSCGQNIVNSGSSGVNDGVSIVGGHEFAESETDPNPPSGWTDTIGAETGDKCAWITFGPGSVTDVTLPTGTFAVQSLWSNAANSGLGGCVT
jgi:serine protease